MQTFDAYLQETTRQLAKHIHRQDEEKQLAEAKRMQLLQDRWNGIIAAFRKETGLVYPEIEIVPAGDWGLYDPSAYEYLELDVQVGEIGKMLVRLERIPGGDRFSFVHAEARVLVNGDEMDGKYQDIDKTIARMNLLKLWKAKQAGGR